MTKPARRHAGQPPPDSSPVADRLPATLVRDETPPPAWPADGTLLRAWAQDLAAALTQKEAHAWRLAGSGVLILTEDPDACRALLRRVAADAGFSLWRDESPGGETPPLAALQPAAPALVLLRTGRWHLSRAAADADININTAEVIGFQERLIQEMQRLDPARPVLPVLCLAPDQAGVLSDILRVPGGFDRCLRLNPVTPGQRGNRFLDELGRARCGPSLLGAPGKVGFAVHRWFRDPTARALAVLHLQRQQHRSGQPLEMTHLLDVAMRGMLETEQPGRGDSGPPRTLVAVHEAGHAVVSLLDSDGENCPDYCTVIAGGDFEGVVVGSLEYHQLNDASLSYTRLRHSIRVALAGRAAEETVFGPEQVTSGAVSDLERCYRESAQAFMRLGFAPDMGRPGASGSNLAVVVGDPTPTEYARIEVLVRKFLAREYAVVCRLLARNRRLLDAVADRMLWDPVVDQAELRDLWLQASPAPGRPRPRRRAK